MKKVLLIALFGATWVAMPAFAEAQDVVTLQDVLALQAAPTPPPAPRPAPAAAPARPPAVPASQAPAAPPPAPAAPLSPLAGLQPTPKPGPPTPNIRFDVTITDTGGAKPVTKTMVLTIGSGNNSGSVRQTAQAPNPTPGPPTIPIALNVDVRNVRWLDNNGVLASVAVEYQLYLPDAKTQPGMVVANATTMFFDGRKMQILVTSDPVSDRRTTIEVTATILK